MKRSSTKIISRIKFAATAALLAALFECGGGCVRRQYSYGVSHSPNPPAAPLEENPTAAGGEHPTLDRLERVVQTPPREIRRLLGREPEVDRDVGRQQSLLLAQEYLAMNSLSDVHLDVRRYEPDEQWSRLRANDRVAPGWKYTLGTLDVLGYTLLPKRVFGVDSYSPYTNTLNLNSGRPPRSLHAAAEAKQYHLQRWLGTYAAAQRLPFVPLVHHASTASDSLTYARTTMREDLESQMYRSSYAKLGGAAVSQAAIVVPAVGGTTLLEGIAVQAAGGIGGGLVGSSVADTQAKRRDAASSPERDPEAAEPAIGPQH